MLNRRSFFGLVASLPFFGMMKPAVKASDVSDATNTDGIMLPMIISEFMPKSWKWIVSTWSIEAVTTSRGVGEKVKFSAYVFIPDGKDLLQMPLKVPEGWKAEVEGVCIGSERAARLRVELKRAA